MCVIILWVQFPFLVTMSELFEIYNLKEMSLSTEIFLSCSIFQLTFYAIATTQQRKNGFVILSQQMYHTSVLIVSLSFLILLNEDLVSLNFFSGNNFIVNDYLGFVAKLIVCITSILFLMLITTSYENKTVQNNFEYTVLILISVLGLFLLCSSNDLITAYLSIELQSIAFYIMAAFKKNSVYSIESGLKYFVIGSLSSAFFLFGSAIIYGCIGSLNFDDIKMFLSLSSISFSDNSCNNSLNFQLNPVLLALTEKNQLNLSSNLQILHHIMKNYSTSLFTCPKTVEFSKI